MRGQPLQSQAVTLSRAGQDMLVACQIEASPLESEEVAQLAIVVEKRLNTDVLAG